MTASAELEKQTDALVDVLMALAGKTDEATKVLLADALYDYGRAVSDHAKCEHPDGYPY